jgi:hypothetical protein
LLLSIELLLEMNRPFCTGLLVLLCVANVAHAQDYGTRLGTIQRGGKISYEPTGPGMLFDALDPIVRKYYVPQELYAEYQWKQTAYSNYARSEYQRYVSTSLEGSYFYDLYGNFLTRGWPIFDWRQESSQPLGSSLFEDRRFQSWFNSLVVAADHKGQFHYSITAGDQIRTTLTPMTFSKVRFDGVQLDFATDKHSATLLLSRISEPDPLNLASGGEPSRRSDNTNLLGGRVETQLGDFVKVGATLVSTHHSQTQADALNGNFLKGTLTGQQNLGHVSFVEVVIRDDSPDDGVAGGSLFASDIVIYDLQSRQLRGSEIGFRPLIEGGFQRAGFLSAAGDEVIRMRYDFSDPSYTGPDLAEIERVEVELVVANDYLIEMTSDRQANRSGREVFTTVARASGNVKDGSNQRVLVLDYGLPTANQITGFTLELDDLGGVRAYMELDINHQFRKYPNPVRHKHHTASKQSEAWLFNLSKDDYPYFAFGEAFSVSPSYSTSMTVVNTSGIVDYGNSLRRFELVDDNDDQDRFPDWKRHDFGTGDTRIFPGWDENNDLVSDFNQNDSQNSPNRVPDYEEPFLRFHTDRPEFQFGVDMNHNGWIDRFENDEEADLPYKRDRRGYNVYGGVHVTEEIRLTLGRTRIAQIADERRSRAFYLLASADKTYPGRVRLRLSQDLRRVRDTIRDDLIQWLQPPNSRGELLPIRDILPAQNTWINTSWMDVQYIRVPGLVLSHLGKWQFYHQRDTSRALIQRDMRKQSSFLGFIDKAQYHWFLGSLALMPAWKSEFRRQVPLERSRGKRLELSELFLLKARLPILLSSHIEAGVEYHVFTQFNSPPPPGAEDSFTELTGLAQLTDVSDYQGYRLTTVVGFSISRQHFEVEGTRVRTKGFLTVYAGVE